MTKKIDIHGYCDPRFKAVRDQFHKHFKIGNEIGASLCLTVEGETVVDLWAGMADKKQRKPWAQNTLATIFSGTKGLAALVTLRLVDQGLIDLEAPVSDYWPEFGQKGKDTIPVKALLNHQAGLVGPNRLLMPWTYTDMDALADSLAKTRPWWVPGSAHGYHAITMGWLLDKLVSNVTGKSVGQYFRDEIARPLNLDIHIGLAEHEHHRVARMELLGGIPVIHKDLINLTRGTVDTRYPGMVASAFTNPISLGLTAIRNSKTWPQLEQPAANGMANARSMAQLYGVLANGGVSQDGYQLLSEEMLAKCWEEQSLGKDLVLRRNTRFSNGFMLSQDEPLAAFGKGERSFGHNGMGGSLSFADPDYNTSFGYVMNKMGTYLLVDVRARALIDTFYRCL